MRKVYPALTLLCISLLFSAILAELVLRWSVGKPVHYRYPQPAYVEDAEIGHWMVPNQRSFTHDQPVQVNSVGIRGPEYSRRPASNTRRILAIGDSQTFGNGVAQPDTWPALLEQRLNDLGQQRWEVLNGGVSGTDTWQHVRILKRLADAYEFDAVVLGFYVNDVTGIWEPGAATERTNTVQQRAGYLLKRSALLLLAWQAYRGLTISRAWQDREQRILTGESSSGLEKGWKEVERSLTEMKRMTGELDASLLVAVLPRRDQVNGREVATAYNQRIAAIASALDVPSMDTLSALKQAYARDGNALFIPWDGHNTSLANAVVAEEVARAMVAEHAPSASERRAASR